MQVTLANIHSISQNLRDFFLPGSIILLNGPIGVGKTTLLKHILFEFDVHSPSFLHALYYGDFFIHIDAYTLNKSQFLQLSIEDYLMDRCVIIEWGDLVFDLLDDFIAKKFVINMQYELENRVLSVKEI